MSSGLPDYDFGRPFLYRAELLHEHPLLSCPAERATGIRLYLCLVTGAGRSRMIEVSLTPPSGPWYAIPAQHVIGETRPKGPVYVKGAESMYAGAAFAFEDVEHQGDVVSRILEWRVTFEGLVAITQWLSDQTDDPSMRAA